MTAPDVAFGPNKKFQKNEKLWALSRFLLDLKVIKSEEAVLLDSTQFPLATFEVVDRFAPEIKTDN